MVPGYPPGAPMFPPQMYMEGMGMPMMMPMYPGAEMQPPVAPQDSAPQPEQQQEEETKE